jgi:hypothetical protein
VQRSRPNNEPAGPVEPALAVMGCPGSRIGHSQAVSIRSPAANRAQQLGLALHGRPRAHQGISPPDVENEKSAATH